ncbi:MAG: tRNA (adenosine(37)-N6)-threonylcarbamoyltransferase complex transferase subunit TsaD [Pseudomonadota bacterium]
MLALGLETSCDETAVALVRREADGRAIIEAERVLSQLDEHAPYGGVVPEIAARAHIDHLDGLVAQCMGEAARSFADLDLVAATTGPGLIGGVLVGAVTGQAIASASGASFRSVNHLEGHALSPRLSADLTFPYLLLLVSGGHTQIVLVEGVGAYVRWGSTLDDALGEAFDKTAKLLELGVPGGPAVERMALQGDSGAIRLPRPLKGKSGCDFSFAGLKTALRLAAEAKAPLSDQDVSDLCAGFQSAVTGILADRLQNALARWAETFDRPPTLVAAGGVAANAAIRRTLDQLMAAHQGVLIVPPIRHCSDNAAMIAWAALERESVGLPPHSTTARPRWPLDETATPVLGHGKKGARA